MLWDSNFVNKMLIYLLTQEKKKRLKNMCQRVVLFVLMVLGIIFVLNFLLYVLNFFYKNI